ncbi:RNA-directed DNA polymerase [Sesamum angolense]|uniref:RNA-directed DNA polymerase n=1 Tax=Sesamum angolense TaxID=2727404 RepID=A0AAE1T903_9LAMI|nr:RNA-directed DNA polymerase [Sesamum angolense]
MYVRVQINGKAVMAMLYLGATHNFVADREIQKLGLILAQHSSRIKAVNSEAKPIHGVACVELKVSAWIGKCNLMVVPLDDFDVILGMDFLLLASAMVIPYLNGFFIADQNSTCFVQGTYLQDSVQLAKKKDSLISAMQVKVGLRHGEQTYLAALIEIKPDVVQEVPDKVVELLQEFKDVFPPELPKKLPPRRAIDHAIELEPGARPPAQAPYRMAPAELAELRKQLDGLLEARLVQPSKAPYGSPVLFQRKQDDLFDKLTKVKYYTKIDLRSGYWQVHVARGDEPKTTCVTSQGKIQMDRKKVVEASHLITAVLKLPQFDKPFEVQVDASDRALRGMLVQDKHPVAFESRKLKDAELRYNTHENEITVAIHCLEAWRHYLLGEFDFEWVYRPGKHNDMADTVSRKLVEEYVSALTVVESDFLDQNQESSKTDAGYLKLVEQVLSGLVRKYWLDSGLLYAKGGGVFVPTGTLSHRLLRETHDPHMGFSLLCPMLALLKQRLSCSLKILLNIVPKDIVSDRKAKFTERFWIALFNMMGTELKFSTADHPQTDGQTERVNVLVEHYLRDYVSASQ